METILEIATGLGLMLGGFAINLLGMASRRSVAFTFVSVLVLITIPSVVFWVFATTAASPFSLSLKANSAHELESWEISRAPIDLTLRFARQEHDVQIFSDASGSEFEATLPAAPLPTGTTSIVLTPRYPLVRAWSYYIALVQGRWIVLTRQSLGFVLASIFFSIIVWLFGRAGLLATVMPDD